MPDAALQPPHAPHALTTFRRGDLTFEVTTPGPVRLIATWVGNSFFLAMGQTDMRKGFDGLAALAAARQSR